MPLKNSRLRQTRQTDAYSEQMFRLLIVRVFPIRKNFLARNQTTDDADNTDKENSECWIIRVIGVIRGSRLLWFMSSFGTKVANFFRLSVQANQLAMSPGESIGNERWPSTAKASGGRGIALLARFSCSLFFAFAAQVYYSIKKVYFPIFSGSP